MRIAIAAMPPALGITATSASTARISLLPVQPEPYSHHEVFGAWFGAVLGFLFIVGCCIAYAVHQKSVKEKAAADAAAAAAAAALAAESASV